MADDRMHATLQENLLTILCWSDESGRLVSKMIKPEYMEGDYRVIAEKAIEYWDKYDAAPKEHTIDIVSEVLREPGNRKAKVFQRILQSMEILSEGINTKFVMEQVRQFTRLQKLKDAVLKSAEKLNANQQLAIGEVEEIWANLLRTNEVSFDPGMRLNDIDRMLEFMEGHYSEFVTGIPQLDRRNIVPTRGAVMLFLAPTGRGKSWWLIHLGKHAIMQRQKVLHITLEMPEDEVVMRYYQSFWSIGKRPRKVKISTLITDGVEDHDEGDTPVRQRLQAVEHDMVEPEWTFRHPHIRDELKIHMGHFGSRFDNLIVKQFPGRTLSMNMLRAYLDMLHQTLDFVPDLVALDYIGITKTDPREHRLSLGNNMEDFRSIMVERNMAGVTAQQVGRAGMKASDVRAIHAAEDISLINTSDVAITYSSSNAEHELGLARLFVDKARNEEDKFGVLITQNYAHGQFCLDSMMLDKQYAAILRDLTGGGDKDKEEEEEEGESAPRARGRDGDK